MSQQVELEPVSEQHAPAVQKLATSHPDIVKLTRLPDPYPEDGAEQWIRQAVPRHKSGDEYSFVIKNKAGKIVGVCGLIVSNEENEAELGYWIGYRFWNQGYATTAIRKALHFAFEEQAFERVFALPLMRNEASQVVLEKNGFRHVETRENTNPKWRETDQIAIYEITRNEWEKYFVPPANFYYSYCTLFFPLEILLSRSDLSESIQIKYIMHIHTLCVKRRVAIVQIIY